MLKLNTTVHINLIQNALKRTLFYDDNIVSRTQEVELVKHEVRFVSK